MKERYFIAVVLPLDIRREVYNFKKIMAERYFARHAFKCPAHITLHMPFKWKSTQKAEFYRLLIDLANLGLRGSIMALIGGMIKQLKKFRISAFS